MGRPLNNYRAFVAVPYVPRNGGNLGTRQLEASRQDAIAGSNQLQSAIVRAGMALAPLKEKPARSFEEQLALVAAGKARVVKKLVIRSRAAETTLGGVADWDALG